MRLTLMTIALICGLFVLMGAECTVNVVPTGTTGPSIGVLPAEGLFGQGLSYTLPDDLGPGVPLVGSRMGWWTVY